MMPIDEFIAGLVPFSEGFAGEGPLAAPLSQAVRVSVSRIEMTMPIGVAYERGGDVYASPPSIAATTGFDPVFQRLRIVLEAEG